MGHEVEPADEPRLREVLQLIPGDSVTAKLALLQSRVPFLAEVSRAQLREFALLSTVHEFRQDEVVFEEGKFEVDIFYARRGHGRTLSRLRRRAASSCTRESFSVR